MWPFKRLLCKRAEKNSDLNQTSKMELLEKIAKRFKDYFCNKLHLRCLIGFEYISDEYLFWKYQENQLAAILFRQ